MEEFRRRQNSDRWHWSKKCSNYPTEEDVIISHTLRCEPMSEVSAEQHPATILRSVVALVPSCGPLNF